MKFLSPAIAGVFFTTMAAAQDAPQHAPVEYRASFENAAHHEAQITAVFRDLPAGPLVLRMARSSPGRYALHEFAKNVYHMSAMDGAGRPLKVERSDPYSWRIAGHDGTVTAQYTLYADHGDGTYSQIDRTHAHLNMPATFIWADGLEDRPISVAFDAPDNTWRAATQLPQARGRLRFTAPNLEYFLDSPTELSAYDLRQWKIADGQTIRLAVHHEGSSQDMDVFAEKAKKNVAELIEIFGGAPKFDYGVYTFIADYLPHATRDGMEHRNSTILSRTDGLYEGEFIHASTLAHEFVHAWNVERMRPAELEPFDFTRTNPTPSLWFVEGFTNYLEFLVMARSGARSFEASLDNLSGNLNYVLNSPGRAKRSPQSMSLEAAFVDAATAVDPTNRANVFVSYYPYGNIVGLALDLTLRSSFEDITIEDYMRHLWRAYGETETPYTHDDLRKGLADVTGDADFAADFFASYIEAGDLPDFEPLFAQAGVKLELTNPDKASLGNVSFKEEGKALIITSNTLIGTPLYEAGLDRGDEILRIGRFKIDDKGDYEKALNRHKPGDAVTIHFLSRGQEIEASATFFADKALTLTPYEQSGMEMTDAHKAFRKSWLKVETQE